MTQIKLPPTNPGRFSLYKSFELVPLATGISYLQQSDYHNQRVNELNKISQSQGYLDTYLEWVLPGDISMRFDVKNVLNNTVVTRRTSYQLSTSDGQVGATELLTSQAGRFWGFSMSGKI
jgi:outer membrane receptor protein involved in Fe transport